MENDYFLHMFGHPMYGEITFVNKCPAVHMIPEELADDDSFWIKLA